MGMIIGKQAEIDAYFASGRVSQSDLKLIIKGRDHYLEVKNKTDETTVKEHFLIGSIVDLLLTGEEGELGRQYFISRNEGKPSEAEMSIVQEVYDSVKDKLAKDSTLVLANFSEEILLATVTQNWRKNWKDETKVSKIIEKCTFYFEDLTVAGDRAIISPDQSRLVDSIVTSLKTDPATSKFFDRKKQKKTKNVTVHYQKSIYFKISDVECKALLDLVIEEYDEELGLLRVTPVDLKTTSGPTDSFVSKVKRFRYDIQGAWYTTGLEEMYKDTNFIIEDYIFIVESTTSTGSPIVYKMSNTTLLIGKYGTVDGFGEKYLGYEELLELREEYLGAEDKDLPEIFW